jgi:hypothetical protein
MTVVAGTLPHSYGSNTSYLPSFFGTTNYISARKVQNTPAPSTQGAAPSTPTDTGIKGVRAQALQMDRSVTPDTVKALQTAINTKFGYKLPITGRLDHNILGILHGYYSQDPNSLQPATIKYLYTGAIPVSKTPIEDWTKSLGGQTAPQPAAPVTAVPVPGQTSSFRGQQAPPKSRLDSSITSSAPIVNLQMSIRSLLPADRKGTMPADGLLGPSTLDAIRDVFNANGILAIAKQAEAIKNRQMFLNASMLKEWTTAAHNLFNGKAQAPQPMNSAAIVKAVSKQFI